MTTETITTADSAQAFPGATITTHAVTSRDGTRIAFERSGRGPAVVLVASALADLTETRKLARLLAEQFTVINYDRRGRGASGDTQPYAVQREIEDIEAVIEAAGGSAFVFGSSSGAVLALRAAAANLDIRKLAVFEPPFMVDDSSPALPADYAARLDELVAANRRNDAVKLFMREAVGVPGPMLFVMQFIPGLWSKMTALAHTLPYDQAVMGDTLVGAPLRASDWVAVTAPHARPRRWQEPPDLPRGGGRAERRAARPTPTDAGWPAPWLGRDVAEGNRGRTRGLLCRLTPGKRGTKR